MKIEAKKAMKASMIRKLQMIFLDILNYISNLFIDKNINEGRKEYD